ncbi:hypothetical protein F2Q69_00052973 [Brassica cretica]|uniref:Uncharacterized protein n=1 Tax=Brassica cretica TaxID=69181 RepID=A0A8S9MQU4_BRACR|nr:hypothetical protein F2Q69_00052973 [Brassica cretica]
MAKRGDGVVTRWQREGRRGRPMATRGVWFPDGNERDGVVVRWRREREKAWSLRTMRQRWCGRSSAMSERERDGVHRRLRCLAMYEDLPIVRLSPSFDTRYIFELAFQFHRFEVNQHPIAKVMLVLLKSGTSASREEAVED